MSSDQKWQQITPDVKLGQNVRINNFVNLYSCEIGDESMIGTFVEIQRGAVIGNHVRIQSHTFICEGVTIEDWVFIGHGVMFINDKYPFVSAPGTPAIEFEKTRICKGVAIGSNSTIMGNITIGENALIGAGSVVTHNVPKNAIVAGNPAKILRYKEEGSG